MFSHLGFPEKLSSKYLASIMPVHDDWIINILQDFDEFCNSTAQIRLKSQKVMEQCDKLENEVKTYLCSGKLLEVSTQMRWNVSASSAIKAYLLLHSKELNRIEKAIEALDLAMLVGEPLPGWDIYSFITVLHEILVESNSNIKEDMRILNPRVNSDYGCGIFRQDLVVQVEDHPSVETFMSDFFQQNRPVKLLNCMSGWAALVKWKLLRYLNSVAGYRIVPVEIGDYSRGGESKERLVTLSQYLDDLWKGCDVKKIGYMAQHQLLNQEPRLLADIMIPDYCAASDSEEPMINCWLGPAGTCSPLHYDPQPNILAQVIGRKKIVLFPPEDTPYMYARRDRFFNTSQVDIEDLTQFPLLNLAQGNHCTLHPGEMLFIPTGWWHHVQSIDISFSVNFFF